LRIQALASSSDWNPGMCSGTRPSCHETKIYHSEPAFDGRAVKVGIRDRSSAMGILYNGYWPRRRTQRRSARRGSLKPRPLGSPRAPRDPPPKVIVTSNLEHVHGDGIALRSNQDRALHWRYCINTNFSALSIDRNRLRRHQVSAALVVAVPCPRSGKR
jgi:hypothetical protein